MLKAAISVRIGNNNNWLGGVNYYRNLIAATNQYSNGRYQLTILTDRPEAFPNASGAFGKIEHCASVNWKSGPLPLLSKIWKRMGRHDIALLRELRSRGVDVVSHMDIGFQSEIATLPWIPDFQHHTLPHLYTPKMMEQGARYIERCSEFGQLLVSSNSAKSDFLRFYPSKEGKVRLHVLPFASMGIPGNGGISRKELQEKYGLPERYFFIPNQFWEHKNHGVVVDALDLADPRVVVVCTGSKHDFRNPLYFDNLMSAAEKRGLKDRFKVLGVVPYADVVGLMHHAVAVVNPSLFEGWSTTVEEAKSHGKRLILSSIPVHLEQAPRDGIFFPADQPQTLALLLDQTLDGFSEEAENIRRRNAVAETKLRQETFIDTYFSILQQVGKPS